MDISNETKIDLLKAKYEDHAADLRFRTEYDYKLISGYVTLNLVIGAWLAKNPLPSYPHKVGFTLLFIGLVFFVLGLLNSNLKRRKIVVEIMQNINDALDFDKEGVYRTGAVNPAANKKTNYWVKWQRAIVLLFLVAQLFIVYGGPVADGGRENVSAESLKGLR